MDETCTVYKTAEIIVKKWTLLILLELYKGKNKKRRYSELKNQLPGITPKILATRLRELEHEGILTKEIDATNFPVKCEYTLTESGRDLIRIVKDLKHWALHWKIKNTICQQIDCKNCEL